MAQPNVQGQFTLDQFTRAIAAALPAPLNARDMRDAVAGGMASQMPNFEQRVRAGVAAANDAARQAAAAARAGAPPRPAANIQADAVVTIQRPPETDEAGDEIMDTEAALPVTIDAPSLRALEEFTDPSRLSYYYGNDWARKSKKELQEEFDRLGATYISYPNETNKDLLQRLDFIKKIKVQNEAYAAMRRGEPIKLEKGFMQTSDFSQEKILSTASNGSPTSKIIKFTNGISEVKIVPDGNGQYFGVQSGKRFGPGKYPDIERWAQRGGFEANEKRELKNVLEAIKDPEKMKAVVFRARKL